MVFGNANGVEVVSTHSLSGMAYDVSDVRKIRLKNTGLQCLGSGEGPEGEFPFEQILINPVAKQTLSRRFGCYQNNRGSGNGSGLAGCLGGIGQGRVLRRETR